MSHHKSNTMTHNNKKKSTPPQQFHSANPALVLLHGTSGFSEDWSGVVDRLAEKRFVIRPDYMNSKATTGAGYTATMAEAISRVVRAADAESNSAFHLVGYSLGAPIAAFIAAEHPERVRSLVLISGFGSGGDVWMKLQFNLWLDLIATDRRGLAKLLLLTGCTRDFLASIDEDTMAELVKAFVAVCDWESVKRSIRLDQNVDVRDELRKIVAPTLTITAKHDQIVPAFYTQELASLIPGVQCAEIDSGHLSFLEQPGPLATTISNYLDSLTSSGDSSSIGSQ